MKIDPAYGVVDRRVRVATANPLYDLSRQAFDPTSVAAGAGSVWSTDGTQTLVRIDPKTGDVVRRINVHVRLNDVAAGTDAVWAISGRSATAIRLDREGRVTLRIPIVSKPRFRVAIPA